MHDNTKIEEQTSQASHDDVCSQALEHYRKISSEAHHWSSTVENAIEFYKKYGDKKYGEHLVKQREREIVKLIRKKPYQKEYDGNNLESASDAYYMHFEDWSEVIRYEDGKRDEQNEIINLINKDL